LRAREAARRVKAQRNILRSDAQRGFAPPSRRERLGGTIPDCAGARDLRQGSGSRLAFMRRMPGSAKQEHASQTRPDNPFHDAIMADGEPIAAQRISILFA
jgi:hypothetical protein